ncbi:YqiA/YcfP family alpha/beta fold hydrolase [Comamonas testosteroni]|uniref:YqiA/YcfP family alpha/beta fold hydrolase n=1 Tax=Comamonas testosteroni TaxID=285 RepID=UPI000A4ED421|nr:YqiA/YcfP family alpha/beta fold hydrolase [Comamonas testosteroni]
MKKIFSGIDVEVYHNEGDSEKKFISFSSWNSAGSGTSFGASFFQKRNIEAYYVCQRKGNHWWHSSEMLQAANSIKNDGKESILYGSSMGGYAACHLQNLFSASASIAIAPQIFVDKKINPLEKRWPADLECVNKRLSFDEVASIGAISAPTYIFYDPLHDLDANHMKILSGSIWGGDIRYFQVPYGNHDVARVLNNSGILKDIIISISGGDIDPGIYARCMKAYLKDKKCFLNFYRKYLSSKSIEDLEYYSEIFDSHTENISGLDFEGLYMLSECFFHTKKFDFAYDYMKKSLEVYRSSYRREPPNYLWLKLENIKKSLKES